MAAHELLVEEATDVVDVEGALVVGNLGVQKHLHEHIAELLGQAGVVVGPYRLDHLVGLLHHVPRYALVRLLLVPRAAV